jgi:putative hydrolase of the HAD superfamily
VLVLGSQRYYRYVRISPSAIIFDYGNVLSQSQPLADVEAMADILNLPLPQFTELYWRFRVPYDAGSLDPTDYWKTLSGGLGMDQIRALMEIDSRSWAHPAPLVPEWARDLRAAGLKIAILSNMPRTVRDYILRCPWLPEFDSRTFSCDVGVCKPDARIYHDCLRQLGAKPSEVLFLDDREANIGAAETLGLHAILFRDASNAAREIEHRFSLPARFGR